MEIHVSGEICPCKSENGLLLVLILVEMLDTVIHFLQTHATSLRPFLFIVSFLPHEAFSTIGARLSAAGLNIKAVVFDAVARRLTYIGVKYSYLLGKTVDLPYDMVSQTANNGIMLHIVYSELTAVNKRTVEGALLDRRSFVARADTNEKGILRQVAVRLANATLAYIVAHNCVQGRILCSERSM